VTVTTQQSVPDRRLDTLVFQSPSGKTRTFSGDIPYEMDGLHWHAYVADHERLRVACPPDEHRRVEAVGTVDGQQVARGHVLDVFVGGKHSVVAVEPPW
jgi:hypothetical protein